MIKKIVAAAAIGAAASAHAGNAAPTVTLHTSAGPITITLNPDKAPDSVENFLRYAKDGHYDGTIFHRVIKGFMIQGGGFDTDMRQRPTHDPIRNEADNGLQNNRGTVAMARTNAPHSATSQFFINHADNAFLNPGGVDQHGYAVFGEVTDGMQVVDSIAGTQTTRRGGHADVPVEAIVIERVEVHGNGD